MNEGSMISSTNCIVCDSVKIGFTYASLRRCHDCGFVFADSDLSDDDYRKLYGEGYFSGEEYANYVDDRPSLERNLAFFLRLLLPYVEHRRTLLEIGCSYGFFLNLARSRFDAIGIDINASGPAYACEKLGVNAVSADIRTHDFAGRKFDVFCMWDTIEHIPDLPGCMERIVELASSDAMLFLTTNDIGSLNARLRRHRWRQIHPPTHLWYFSRRTIRHFLAKYGFEVLELRSVGYSRSVGNMLHNVLKGRLAVPRALLNRAGIGRVNFCLNLGDIFWLAARKV